MSLKRIVIEVTKDDHHLIKRLALDADISMRKWILLAIALKIRTDNQTTMHELMEKLRAELTTP